MAIFAAWVTYTNHEERLRVRPAHRAYLAQLLTDGKLVASGPFTDETGALLIYNASDEAEVRAIMAADPNSAAGAFASIELKEWNRVFAETTAELRP